MIKRVFDFLCALLGLIVLSPLLLLIALLIFCEDFHSPIFRQVRIGRDGRPFGMLKFRSMRVGSDKSGPSLTVSGDSRITHIGSVLRATKLDELPQLWNVLLGQMSFIGPRPEVEKYVRLYNDHQRQVLSFRPGITDIASVMFYDESEQLAQAQNPEEFYIREIMPKKIEMNLAYAKRANLFSDLGIIFATLGRMFSGKSTK